MEKNLLNLLTALCTDSLPFLFKGSKMSLGQWFMENKTGLFKWKKWSPFHTFASVNLTLFIIRGLVGLLKIVDKLKGKQDITPSQG
jgi:hypothetical protein